MLVGGVVYNKVHNYLYVELVRFGYEAFHIVERAILGVNVPVVAYVVAVIGVWRPIYRRQPYYTDPQLLNLGQLRNYAGNVACTVTVGILKAARVYLVYYPFLPPSTHQTPPVRLHGLYLFCTN